MKNHIRPVRTVAVCHLMRIRQVAVYHLMWIRQVQIDVHTTLHHHQVHPKKEEDNCHFTQRLAFPSVQAGGALIVALLGSSNSQQVVVAPSEVSKFKSLGSILAGDAQTVIAPVMNQRGSSGAYSLMRRCCDVALRLVSAKTWNVLARYQSCIGVAIDLRNESVLRLFGRQMSRGTLGWRIYSRLNGIRYDAVLVFKLDEPSLLIHSKSYGLGKVNIKFDQKGSK